MNDVSQNDAIENDVIENDASDVMDWVMLGAQNDAVMADAKNDVVIDGSIKPTDYEKSPRDEEAREAVTNTAVIPLGKSKFKPCYVFLNSQQFI